MPAVVDYSAARPGAAAITAAGAAGVVRYVGALTAEFNLTGAEVDDLQAAGLGIGIVIEQRTGDILLGRGKGAEMAALAQQATRALGLPDGLVWAPVDIDATLGGPTRPGSPGDRQMMQVASTLQGFADVLGWEQVGCYGGWYVIQWLIDHSVPVAAFWQASAPSWSETTDTHRFQVHPRAVLRQHVTHPDTPAGCDFNDVLGDWRPRVPKVVPVPAIDVRHIQNLLSKRGDFKTAGWPIAVDGVMGRGGETERAVKEFQRSYQPARLTVDGVPGAQTEAALRAFRWFGNHLSPNFTFGEFACGDGHCEYCDGWMSVPRAVLSTLEAARARLYVPRKRGGLRVVGGSRCERRNRKLGGASNSQHLHKNNGNAADVDPYFTVEEWITANTGATAYEIRKGHGRLVWHVDDRGGDPWHPAVFPW